MYLPCYLNLGDRRVARALRLSENMSVGVECMDS